MDVWLPLTGPHWGPGRQPWPVPDWESNQRPFGSQASAQSTEPHQPRLSVSSLKLFYCAQIFKIPFQPFVQFCHILCSKGPRFGQWVPLHMASRPLDMPPFVWHCLPRDTPQPCPNPPHAPPPSGFSHFSKGLWLPLGGSWLEPPMWALDVLTAAGVTPPPPSRRAELVSPRTGSC